MVFQEKKKKPNTKNIKTVLYLVSELINSFIIWAPVLNSCLIQPWSDSKLYSKYYTQQRDKPFPINIHMPHFKKISSNSNLTTFLGSLRQINQMVLIYLPCLLLQGKINTYQVLKDRSVHLCTTRFYCC